MLDGLSGLSGLPAIFGGARSLATGVSAFWKLDEASGTRADSKGANHLTDNNTVTQAVGKIGNAAQFTSLNSEYLSIPDNADVSTGDIDFTIAGWVYPDTLPGAYFPAFFDKRGGGTPNKEFWVYYNGTAQRFEAYVSSNGQDSGDAGVMANSFGAATTATWYFVVFWHDSVNNTLNLQINNGTIDSVAHAAGVFNGAGAFELGRISGLNHYWNGRIDAVGLWKKVLTAAERTELYNAGNGREYPFS